MNHLTVTSAPTLELDRSQVYALRRALQGRLQSLCQARGLMHRLGEERLVSSILRKLEASR